MGGLEISVTGWSRHTGASERRTGFTEDARLGVIDIGSNSIRLVVYQPAGRALIPILNEKTICGLGRGLAEHGRLSLEGRARALETLARFALLAQAMEVESLDVVATSAVRDAADGAEFVSMVERRCRVTVRVLSGGEEARLSAQGVLANIPDADGLVGDLGGGSLELVALNKGRTGAHMTLPLGVLRLLDRAQGDVARATELIDKELKDVPWLDELKGRRFYAVGGAWRALARIHMAQTGYPLRIIDRYMVKRARMESVVSLVSRMSRRSLERIPGVPRRRMDALPMAALVMERLLRKGAPKRVMFSGFGLREGVAMGRLPAAVQKQDSLIAVSADAAQRYGRDPAMGEALFAWTAPLFGRGESAPDARLRRAACLLSDVAWADHPDYRAEQALNRVMRLSVLPIDHPGRAFLGLAVYHRHGGSVEHPAVQPVRALLDDALRERARHLGLALRLGATLSGGAPSLLASAALSRDGERVALTLPKERMVLAGEDVQRRLHALAEALGLKPATVEADQH